MATRSLLITCTVLFAGALPASATTYDNCLRADDGQRRLEACDQVLAGSSFNNAQKARAHRERGSLLAEAGAHKDAINAFNAALALDPDDARTYEKRGLAHLVLGRHDAALKDLDKAVRLRPVSARLLTVRGYVKMVAGQLDPAIADFDAAIKLQPRNAVAFNNRGLAHRKKGDLAKALSDYKTAIDIRPTYALAHANRGFVLEQQGRKADAVASFKAALRIDPGLQGASTGLQRLGEDEAGRNVSSIAAEGKTLATLLCSRCHAIEKTGDSPNANSPPFRNLGSRYPLLEIREPITRGIAAPHAEMPAFNLTPGDVDKIIAYVNSLNQRQ